MRVYIPPVKFLPSLFTCTSHMQSRNSRSKSSWNTMKKNGFWNSTSGASVTYVKCRCHILDDIKNFTYFQVDVVSASFFHIPCRPWKHHSITKWSIKNLFHEHAVIKKSFFILCSHVSVQQGTFDFPIFQRCSNFIQVAILMFCYKKVKQEKYESAYTTVKPRKFLTERL